MYQYSKLGTEVFIIKKSCSRKLKNNNTMHCFPPATKVKLTHTQYLVFFKTVICSYFILT